MQSLRPCINRNIVECKGAFKPLFVMSALGINRNIVECKEITCLNFGWKVIRINRNIVECKEIHAYLKLQTSYVLIETLWNVKRANISDIMA